MFDIKSENLYPTPLANSSLLNTLLLSLMLQKHAPTTLQTPLTIRDEYDFIIVGAGSAGSTLANRLSESACVSVLLLEAGKPPPLLTEVPAFGSAFWNSDIDWAYKTVPQKHAARLQYDRKIIMPAGKSLGGSSTINAQLFVRGNHRNYDEWAELGAEGWAFNDVLPYFKKLEDNQDQDFFQNGYHGVGGPVTAERPAYTSELSIASYVAASKLNYGIVDSNGPRQTGFFDTQGTTRNHQRCSTAKAYLVPAENRTNLHILPNALAHKVIIENKQAVGVKFEVGGIEYQVKSKREVILSAGAVNTPQLLMLSGIGPKKELKKHKIPIIEDLDVGKNFQDHCASIVSFDLDPSIKPVMQKLIDGKNVLEYIDNRTGILSSLELGSSQAFLDSEGNPNDDFPRYELYITESDTLLFRILRLTEEAYNKVYKSREGKPFYICAAQVTQPKSKGSIKLQSSDPHDLPLVDPKYFSHPDDIQAVVDGMKTCLRIGTSEPLLQIGSKPFNITYPGCEKYLKHGIFSDQQLKCQAKAFSLSMSHPVGTARMGDLGNKATVVDPELRVKNIGGLRVVDASVMPILPSGNTNIPTIMIAEKAADIIKRNLPC